MSLKRKATSSDERIREVIAELEDTEASAHFRQPWRTAWATCDRPEWMLYVAAAVPYKLPKSPRRTALELATRTRVLEAAKACIRLVREQVESSGGPLGTAEWADVETYLADLQLAAGDPRLWPSAGADAALQVMSALRRLRPDASAACANLARHHIPDPFR